MSEPTGSVLLLIIIFAAFDLTHIFSEPVTHGLVFVMVPHLFDEIFAEKQNEIQQRCNYRKCGCKIQKEEIEKQKRTHYYADRYADPLHFYRDKEVKIKLFIGIKHCISEEKTDIQIIIVRISDNKACNDIQKSAHKVVDCEFECSPCTFERHSDHVEQEQGKYHSDKALEIGDKQECYHPPDLPSEDSRSVKAKHCCQVQIAEAEVCDKDHQHRSDDVQDKIVYPEFSVFIFEFIKQLVQFYDLLCFVV